MGYERCEEKAGNTEVGRGRDLCECHSYDALGRGGELLSHKVRFPSPQYITRCGVNEINSPWGEQNYPSDPRARHPRHRPHALLGLDNAF